jgi:acetyl-CoA carboxylase carboxyl transferase subunit alpha
MIGELEFERPVTELRKKIAELKEYTKTAEVDFSAEIEKLETRFSTSTRTISTSCAGVAAA